MSQCPTFNCSELSKIHLELQAYPDIAGRGVSQTLSTYLIPHTDRRVKVIIGFVGTTYFVFILALCNYFLAYDPERYPFLEPDATNKHTSPPATRNSQLSNNPSWWRPNPIDVSFLRWVRRIAAKLVSSPGTINIWDSQRVQIMQAFDLVRAALVLLQMITLPLDLTSRALTSYFSVHSQFMRHTTLDWLRNSRQRLQCTQMRAFGLPLAGCRLLGLVHVCNTPNRPHNPQALSER